MTFYLWALLGCELLHYTRQDYEAQSNNESLAIFEDGVIGNFQTFFEGVLALFQITTGSSWHYVSYYLEIFHGFWLTWMILFPFHLIMTYVLRSILLGMIWEVFVIINNDSDFLVKSIMLSEEDDEYNFDEDYTLNKNNPEINPMTAENQKTIISSSQALAGSNLLFNNLY